MTAVIRRIRPAELAAAERLVQSVVAEVYGYIWQGAAPPASGTDWTPSFVVELHGDLAGLMLSQQQHIEDLWVAQAFRGQGLGSRLLAIGEGEIRQRGFDTARLRVVAGNDLAAEFYKRRGWKFIRQYRHETLPVEAMDFEKRL